MSDDIGKTAARKPIQQERRVRKTSPEQQGAGVDAARNPAKGQRKRTRGRANSTPDRRQRSQMESTRRAKAPARRNSVSARAGAHAARSQSRRGVPMVVFVIAIVVCIVASVLITRSIMIGEVREARSEATAAQNKASSLADQLQKKNSEVKTGAAAGMTDANETSSNDTSAKDSTTQTGVESPWIANGKFTSGDTTLDEEVKSYVDSMVDSSASIDDAAFEMYKSIAWSDYVERDSAQSPSGKNWRTEFARMYYENGCSGNCYEFAAFLMYCLQYMGFSDAKAEATLVELQGGGWGDHAIVYVTNTDGSSCICDTARGTNAWMIPASSYNVQIQDLENA